VDNGGVEMSMQTMSPAAIRKAGLEAVAKKLGPVGMVRSYSNSRRGVEITPRSEASGLKMWISMRS
jgi:hypothetical protein